MSKLYFLVDWLPGNKEGSWSGTNMGLYKALQGYFDVEDIDLHRPVPLFRRVLRKLRLVESGDCGIFNIKANRRRVMPMVNRQDTNAQGKNTVFQFAEIVHDSPHVQTYIYQDLAVPYIDYMRNHLPDDYAVSTYQDIPVRHILQRAKTQMEYYRSCSGIFTMGKWLKKYLVDECQLSECKIMSTGGGINVNKDLIEPNPQKNGKRILFIGRDYVRKGLPELYEAFLILRQSVPDAELYVAGPANNPYPNATEGYHYMGDCSHDKLSELFNLCDIFAMPSHFEAYGLVFIEALTYGLPCLARDAYEMPYFIEDGKTGILIDDYDRTNMAAQLQRLLADEEIKRNVVSKREWYIKEYSWETVAERINNAINKRQ